MAPPLELELYFHLDQSFHYLRILDRGVPRDDLVYFPMEYFRPHAIYIHASATAPQPVFATFYFLFTPDPNPLLYVMAYVSDIHPEPLAAAGPWNPERTESGWKLSVAFVDVEGSQPDQGLFEVELVQSTQPDDALVHFHDPDNLGYTMCNLPVLVGEPHPNVAAICAVCQSKRHGESALLSALSSDFDYLDADNSYPEEL